MAATGYERLKEVRRRKAAGLVAVRVGGETFDLPADKIEALREWCKDQVDRPSDDQ